MKKRLFIIAMTTLLVLTSFVGLASAIDHPDPMIAPVTSTK